MGTTCDIRDFQEEVPDFPEPADPRAVVHMRDGREIKTVGAPGMSVEALVDHLRERGMMDESASWREVDAEYLPPDLALAVDLAAVDAETRALILAGFDHAPQGERLHFDYDAHEQQNFADQANQVLQARIAGHEAEPVAWKATRNGQSVTLTLSADQFMDLYAAALNHKAFCRQAGDARKAVLRAEPEELTPNV